MKKILLLLQLFQTSLLFAQVDLFPMKGDYIYYEFKEETKNTEHCIMHYSCMMDSTMKMNPSAMELMMNVLKKSQNMNEMKVTLVGLKNTTVNFAIQPTTNHSCTGEIKSPSGFYLTLPTGAQLLESNLLFSLFTVGKFKVSSQMITATIKVEFESNNKYSLIFTNFKIKYTGTQGSKVVIEELDLEEVYKTLQEKGKQDDKMYDKGLQTMKEIDEIIKSLANIYSKELKRTYEIDEL